MQKKNAPLDTITAGNITDTSFSHTYLWSSTRKSNLPTNAQHKNPQFFGKWTLYNLIEKLYCGVLENRLKIIAPLWTFPEMHCNISTKLTASIRYLQMLHLIFQRDEKATKWLDQAIPGTYSTLINLKWTPFVCCCNGLEDIS